MNPFRTMQTAIRLAESRFVAWRFQRPGLQLWVQVDRPFAASSWGSPCWSPPRRSGAAPSSRRSRR